ncbi:hypothetical protein FZ025_06635 [Xanthomonas hyacinthi]|uniref:Uncharacterized protein n=1 Tax=Xanthomonas hyacinthi TaxID=56455 RepID=A0A2S7EW25_9XANT|nr:hypothetical protein [Xanthomonas hyacinthi]PPU97334.1 hypothetical protein XhyaCFBP1156_11725 [Xanthomonas hyacinthi]QGY76360.1 hypothetical protein FZ025_06635 [Xanthomonas hyacinthi]
MAASALARKGAFELREALHGLPVQLPLPPGAQQTPQFWSGLDVRRVGSMAAGVQAAAVVGLPAWVEPPPRGLLLALALGRPAIASAACGLGHGDGAWRCVDAGDAAALRSAGGSAGHAGLRTHSAQYRSCGSTSSDQRTRRACGSA